MSFAEEMTRPTPEGAFANRTLSEQAERDVSVFCVHLVWFSLTLALLALSFTLFFAPTVLWNYAHVLAPVTLIVAASVLVWLSRQCRRLGPCSTDLFSASTTNSQQ